VICVAVHCRYIGMCCSALQVHQAMCVADTSGDDALQIHRYVLQCVADTSGDMCCSVLQVLQCAAGTSDNDALQKHQAMCVADTVRS